MRTLTPPLVMLFIAILWSTPAAAVYERAGWQAELSTRFHGVTGTVTIVDEFTLQIDNFNYDGQGISVYFWLDNPSPTETGFNNGVQFGPQLKRPQPYVDESFLFDLGTYSLDGHDAISVWCVTVGISFGDGVFEPPPAVPGLGPLSGLLTAIAMAILGFKRCRG